MPPGHLLQRMARAPSYRAPRAAAVLHPPPFVPDLADWRSLIAAEDVVERDGEVISLSLTGRAYITLGSCIPAWDIRLIAVAPYMGELAATPHLAKVARLNLAGNRIGPAGIRLLATSPFLSRLTHLDLSTNDLGAEGLVELRRADWLHQLHGLILANNNLPVDAVVDLLASPCLRQCQIVTNEPEA